MSVNPNQGRELADILILPDLPDVDLRDWEMYDQTVEAGYVSAMAALKNARGPIARIINSRQAAPAELAD